MASTLTDRLDSLLGSLDGGDDPWIQEWRKRMRAGGDTPTDMELRIDKLRMFRPILPIQGGKPVFDAGMDSQEWEWFLREPARWGWLKRAARASGRVELEKKPGKYGYEGTGWLVDDERTSEDEKRTTCIMVTNRHVADQFLNLGKGRRGRFVGQLKQLGASLDFLEELQNPRQFVANIEKVLELDRKMPRPDLALLQVRRRDDSPLPPAIPLDSVLLEPGHLVGAIGYPKRSPKLTDPDGVQDHPYVADTYGKKRLAAGKVKKSKAVMVEHDCWTAGGNSGSVLLSLQNGCAVGVHSSIGYNVNTAVVGAIIKEWVKRAQDKLEQ